MMRYRLARTLQLIGLLILPVAIAGNVANDKLSLGQSLVLSAVGVAVFFTGHLLQESSKP